MASETSGVQESKNQNSAPGVNLAPRDASSPQKSLKFWFSDGNFVLQASETQYRVHRGVLSNQSSVFEDMFAFPQPITPDAADELVEGCPVVTVLDSSKDWEILLGVLYNTDRYAVICARIHIHRCEHSMLLQSIFWEDTRSFTMEAMFAMLRLGHKYDFARFKEEALQQLKAMFPSTFVEWEKSLVTCPNQFMLIQDRYFECTRAIEDLGIQAALPVAYFLCTHAASLVSACPQINVGSLTPFSMARSKSSAAATGPMGLCFFQKKLETNYS